MIKAYNTRHPSCLYIHVHIHDIYSFWNVYGSRFTDHHDLSNPRQLSGSSLRILEELWETLQVAMVHFQRLGPELPAELYQPVSRSLEDILRYLRRVREGVQSGNRWVSNNSPHQQLPKSYTTSLTAVHFCPPATGLPALFISRALEAQCNTHIKGIWTPEDTCTYIERCNIFYLLASVMFN